MLDMVNHSVCPKMSEARDHFEQCDDYSWCYSWYSGVAVWMGRWQCTNCTYIALYAYGTNLMSIR